MPKIAAPTVAEHRQHVRDALVAAAEALLRAGKPLTAGAVTASVGIARNSIYRYVDSVDDLHTLVLARYLPAWDQAVSSALAELSDPGDQVLAWVQVNFEQAVDTGHGWLMSIARNSPRRSATAEVASQAHRTLRDSLGTAWLQLASDPERARVQTTFTNAMLGSALQLIEVGVDPASVLENLLLTTRSQIAAVISQQS